MRTRLASVMLAGTLLMPTLVAAQSVTGTATVMTDLNLRIGPGPGYYVITTMPANATVNVFGCVDDRSWCDVDFNGTRGWAFAAYLTYMGPAAAPLPAPIPLAQVTVNPPPVIVYNGEEYFTQHYQTQAFYNNRADLLGAAGGVAAGAVIGAIIAGPVGAAVGAAVGAGVGAAVIPPQTVVTYVQQQPRPSQVFLSGEVVVGAALPANVVLTPIPDYNYAYAYVNGRLVLVDPSNHVIVGIMAGV